MPQLTDAAIRAHIDALAKPRGSLGHLEAVAYRLARVQNTLAPVTRPRRLVLFAADHGVVAAGVSAWPSAVTAAMVATIALRRAASNALAAASGTDLRLIDVGVLGSGLPDPPAFYRNARIRAGTADLAEGPALSAAEFDAAWDVGAGEALAASAEGVMVLAAGEMGIGNTTPSACLAMLLAEVPLDLAAGRGAGADAATMARKRAVASAAVARARPLLASDPKRAIASVCGLEIAAMAGFYARAAQAEAEAATGTGATIVLDGYVTGAAALIAEHLAPGSRHRFIAGHVSAEPGHAGVLAALGLSPVLDWGLRLGEGTGALLAMPMLDAAAALLRDVARLDEIGA